MGLHARMLILVFFLFAIIYGVVVGVSKAIGIESITFYIVMTLIIIGFQYLISPSIISWTMRVRWVSEDEAPELHRMVEELSRAAGIPKPKVGISELSIPNAFAFGRTVSDGRVCVTRGILRLLSYDELKAVLGHEISHIKNRDMLIMTLLSAVPLILYHLAWGLMWGGAFGGRREGAGYLALLGFMMFILYFVTNLLVLYGSRIREYYADRGSVKLGNPPHHLASALYKLVLGSLRTNKEELRRVEGAKAFFLNDPSKAFDEVKELAEVDRDRSGTIDMDELLELRRKRVRLSLAERLMELLSTHPNTLKRIKHLSSLTL